MKVRFKDLSNLYVTAHKILIYISDESEFFSEILDYDGMELYDIMCWLCDDGRSELLDYEVETISASITINDESCLQIFIKKPN